MKMTTINSSQNYVLSAPPAGGFQQRLESFILTYPTAGVTHPAVFDSSIIAERATLRFCLPQAQEVTKEK